MVDAGVPYLTASLTVLSSVLMSVMFSVAILPVEVPVEAMAWPTDNRDMIEYQQTSIAKVPRLALHHRGRIATL